MAAAATIDSLTDELLVAIFWRVPGYAPEVPELRNRLVLEAVCRRWRAVAASPAAAPEYGEVAVHLAGDGDKAVKLLRWLAVHGARVRGLRLNLGGAQDRAWAAALPLLALAPGLRMARLVGYRRAGSSAFAPAGAEWWHHLAPSLTQLDLCSLPGAALDGVHRRGGLPPRLACLEIICSGMVRLPPALGELAGLTRLRVMGGVDEATPAAFGKVLPRLAALQILGVNLWLAADGAGQTSALPAVPLAVGALGRLKFLSIGGGTTCGALAAPGALEPLVLLPRLERLEMASAAVRQPSALTRPARARPPRGRARGEGRGRRAARRARAAPVEPPRAVAAHVPRRRRAGHDRRRAAAAGRAAARRDGVHGARFPGAGRHRQAARLLPPPHRQLHRRPGRGQAGATRILRVPRNTARGRAGAPAGAARAPPARRV